MYKQVILTRVTEKGTARTTCWLPEKHKDTKLEPGVRVRLEGQEDWWTVQSVSNNTRTKSEVREHERIARKYRQTTDI
jgi:hypothetical protein